nr:unnamed protein product [uncultured bacterium]
MKIINTVTGEIIGTILTNHSMTIEEALDLIGEKCEDIGESFDNPDYIVDGKEVWCEECTLDYSTNDTDAVEF